MGTQHRVTFFLGILEKVSLGDTSALVLCSVHLQTPTLIPHLEQQLGLCKQLWWDGKTTHWAYSTQLHQRQLH